MSARIVRNLLFVDTETTGLDPLFNEVIEVGAILTTPDGLKVLETYEAKVRPVYIERAHPKALEVNGYNEAEWAVEKCTPRPTLCKNFSKLSREVILVGQNISFDEAFLTSLLASEKMKPTWHYHKVDTMSLAWPLYVLGEMPGLSLSSICEALGLPPEPSVHRAMLGAQSCRAAYLKLMERYTRTT